MNLRDSLLAGSEYGTDRLPVDADRRLRRRLGLESARACASARRVWIIPAFAAVALAAVVALVLFQTPQVEPTQHAAAGFVDISKARWQGTVTGDSIDVHASSPASASVTWGNASIVAAPGTRLTTSADGSLVLAEGAIQIHRSDVTPLVVAVPMGRVVIAAYHASVTADRESVTILLDDGSGQYIDAGGQTHSLIPATPLVWPPPSTSPVRTGSAVDATAPIVVPPSRTKRHGYTTYEPGGASPPPEVAGPPGASVPRRPDVPCTFKSDCEPDATCRKNESGTSVCMGNGKGGAACWFDSDCLSHSCTQRRCASGLSTP